MATQDPPKLKKVEGDPFAKEPVLKKVSGDPFAQPVTPGKPPAPLPQEPEAVRFGGGGAARTGLGEFPATPSQPFAPDLQAHLQETDRFGAPVENPKITAQVQGVQRQIREPAFVAKQKSLASQEAARGLSEIAQSPKDAQEWAEPSSTPPLTPLEEGGFITPGQQPEPPAEGGVPMLDPRKNKVLNEYRNESEQQFSATEIADRRRAGTWGLAEDAREQTRAFLHQQQKINERAKRLRSTFDALGQTRDLKAEGEAIEQVAAALEQELAQLQQGEVTQQQADAFNAKVSLFQQKQKEYADLLRPINEESEYIQAWQQYVTQGLTDAKTLKNMDPRERMLLAKQFEADATDGGGYAGTIDRFFRRMGGNIAGLGLRTLNFVGNIPNRVTGSEDYYSPFAQLADEVDGALERIEAEKPKYQKTGIISDEWGVNPGFLHKMLDGALYAGTLAVAGASGGVRGMSALGIMGSSEDYYREGIDSGLKPQDAEIVALLLSSTEASIEALNLGPFVNGGARKSIMKGAVEAIKNGTAPRIAAKESFGRYVTEQMAGEGGEEVLTSVAQSLVKRGAEIATGVDQDTELTAKGLAGDALMGAAIGGVMGASGRMSQRPLYKEGVAWAVQNGAEFRQYVAENIPKAEQAQILERFEVYEKVYRGLPDNIKSDRRMTIAHAIAEKERLKKEQSNVTIDDTVAAAIGDTNAAGMKEQDEIIAGALGIDLVEVARKNEADRLREQYEKAKLKSELTNTPMPEGMTKPAEVKIEPKVEEEAPVVEAEEELIPDDGVTATDEDVEGFFAEETTPLTPEQEAGLMEEARLVAKALKRSIGVQLKIFDEDEFVTAAAEAGADADASLSEGFFVGKDNTIVLNKKLLRAGLAAHEGTHAVIFAALSGSPNGKAILASSAKQALNASPEATKVIAGFLRGYGGAKMKADGTIDVDATVSDPELAHEVVAEFVAGIYNGSIKLDNSVKNFLRDLYNRVMAALGISTEFNPQTDSDFVAMAKQLASAMKAGRAISARGGTGTQEVQFSKAKDKAGRPILVDPKKAAALKRIWNNLDPSERQKLNRASAEKLVDTVGSLPSASEMAAVAHAGRAKKGWYENSAKAILHVFGKDAPRFAAVLAATSPQVGVKANLSNALLIWEEWTKRGKPTDAESILSTMRDVLPKKPGGDHGSLQAWENNTVRALSAEDPESIMLSGPKVNSFMMNLRGHVNEVANDTWMSNYALVDQKLFAGSGYNPSTGDPGKSPGYLAMTAQTREAAKKLTELTGETWTPAEVQETVWSWAKALYEMAAGEERTAKQIIEDEALTNELINSTPDFRTLFHTKQNEDLLKRSGYAEEISSLRSRDDLGGAGRQVAGTEGKAGPFDRDTQKRHEKRAAARLDERRAQSLVTPAAPAGAIDASYVPFSRRTASDGSLNGLPRKFKIGDKEMTASHWQPAEDVAMKYMEKAGLPYNPPLDYVNVDPERAKKIAAEYDKMKHDPNNPEVAASFKAMADETMAQWQAIKESGLKVEFMKPGPDGKFVDPYAASPRMATEDVRNNNHLWVFPTEGGYGHEGSDSSSHPLLADSGEVVDGRKTVINDIFRIVHDYFGHIKEGVGFRAAGEENAWRAHSAMYSPLARRAMTTETRGQNSWVNYGPHGSENQSAKGADTIYADQKAGLMPRWVSEEGRTDGPSVLFSKKAAKGVDLTPPYLRKELTDDKNGNYVFFHKGPADLEGGKIDPSFFGTGKSKDRRSNAVMNYYTKPDHGERMITGDVTYAVPVPKWKVYPLMSDPLDLYDKAEENFRKKFGKQQAFDAVRQADFIGPLAAEAGFDMMVAGWSVHPLRAESTKALRPDMKMTEKYAEESLVDLTTPEGYANWLKVRRSVKTGKSIRDLVALLVAAGYNTKSKAKAKLEAMGREDSVAPVLEEFDRIRTEQQQKKVEPAKKEPAPEKKEAKEAEEEGEGEKAMRATARRIKAQYPELGAALSDAGVMYERLPNSVSREAAQELIGYLGQAAAIAEVQNEKSDIPGAVRSMMFISLMDQLVRNKNYALAATLEESYVEQLTKAGQQIQAMADIAQTFFTKEAEVFKAKKRVNKQRAEKEKNDKNHKPLREGIEDINAMAAEEAVRAVRTRKKAATVSAVSEGVESRPSAGYGTKNRIVKKSAYEQAWKELMGQLPSGIPHQLVTIAAYHIEAGSRSFAEVAEKVIRRGGKKLLPYLKGAYKQAAKELEVEPTADFDIDEFIAKVNTDKVVAKLKNAIEKKDAKGQADAIAALQQVAKDMGVWGLYRDDAASRLKRMAEQTIREDVAENAALDDFTKGLVRNMTAKMKEDAQEAGKEPAEPKQRRSDIQIIGDAFKNFEKYEDVWIQTQNEFMAKLRAAEARLEKAETPEAKQEAEQAIAREEDRLAKLDAYFGDVLRKPFSDAGVGRAVRDGMKELGQKIDAIVKQHYTVAEAAKRSLADKLVQEAGLTGAQAQELSNVVIEEFNRIATARKKQIIDQYIKRKADIGKTRTTRKNLEDELIQLTNAGAFSNDEFIEKYGEIMGWPTLTLENINEIERLAERVQSVPEGRPRFEAVEDLLRYQANLAGVSKWELIQSVWYANMLSGYETHEVNAIANFAQVMMEAGVAAAQKPRDTKYIAKAIAYGLSRGFPEAVSTLKTGYSPIRGKVDIPAALERHKFEGVLKPYNVLKFVRRAMVAADVLFFESAKEMRAYQLAIKMARSEDPSQDVRQRALEIMNRGDDVLQNAKDQAQAEYEAELIEIENSKSGREAELARKKAKRDRGRRVFELVEKGRPENILTESARFAARTTYNYAPEGALGAVANGLNSTLRAVPALRYIIPFVNIIANVANESLNYYPPTGIARAVAGGSITEKLTGKKSKLSPEQQKQQRADLITKAAIGTALMTLAFVLSDPGDDDDPFIEITGNGYGDWKKNKSLEETGWRPYSIKIGDRWISYQYTPLILVFGLVGAYRDAEKYRKEKLDDAMLTKFAVALGRNTDTFFNQTFLTSLKDNLTMLMDPSGEGVVEKFQKSAARTAKTLVLPNMYNQIARNIESAMDVPSKDVRGDILGEMVKDIPVLRDRNEDLYNALGEKVIPESRFLRRFQSPTDPDPVWALMAEKGYGLSSPAPGSLSIVDPATEEKRVMTPEERHEFYVVRGKEIRVRVEKDFKDLEAMTKKEFEEEMRGIVAKATRKANKAVAKLED